MIKEVGFFKKRKILKEMNYLELTPVRRFEYEIAEDGLVNILIPKFKNKFLNKFIPTNKPADIRIKLDELGSFVFQQIDEQKKVHEISELLSEKTRDTIQSSYERTTKFLTLLYSNQYISFKEILINDGSPS
ncbi:MAG: PqqD family protein [Bacteroidota bacterium]|nr:PqqD family protein [Bacteroidota bacterium]